jgi:hypothetical protein
MRRELHDNTIDNTVNDPGENNFAPAHLRRSEDLVDRSDLTDGLLLRFAAEALCAPFGLQVTSSHILHPSTAQR